MCGKRQPRLLEWAPWVEELASEARLSGARFLVWRTHEDARRYHWPITDSDAVRRALALGDG